MAAEPGDLLSDAGADVLAQLGERLRARRHELERTLASVSAEAQVSVSYLSELEAGASTPSLAVLARLAHALGLSLNELLRATSSSPIATGALVADHQATTPMSAQGLRLQVVSLVRGAADRGTSPLGLVGTDLFVYVHAGRLRVRIDGQSYELAEGDSLEATRPRAATWEAVGEGRCVSLWVTHRPERVSP